VVSARCRAGFALSEATIALSVLVLLVGTLQFTGPSNAAFIARSLRETVALREASSRLEVVTSGTEAPVAGPFPLSAEGSSSLPGGAGEIELLPVAAGLVDVVVRVRWEVGGGAGTERIEIVTRLAREEAP
jgi:hypothetical protein